MSTTQLPIIDFAPFLEGTHEGKLKVGTEMVRTMRDIGFMYIINHGIPKDKQDEIFRWCKAFFDMNEEQKMKCPHPENPEHHRGYSAIGKEKVIQMEADENSIAELWASPDVKESFDMGNEKHEKYCNFWPAEDDLPGFKKFCVEYFQLCDDTTKLFLRAIALGMGLDENALIPSHSKSENALRLLHYPPTDEASLKVGKAERISAHTDYGTFTMLLQDQCGGLEVEDAKTKGVFVPAPYVEGSLVFNTADCLQRWSNDTLKSTMHRVRAPPVDSETGVTRARYSIPYFVTANSDAIVDALPGTFSEERPKKYDSITVGDWMRMRIKASY